LHIQCGEAGSAALTLRLLPTCDPDMLQMRKLAPDANAVRTISGQPATAQAEQTGVPTPQYNTSILQVSHPAQHAALPTSCWSVEAYMANSTRHTLCLHRLAQDALLPRHAAAVQAAVAALPRLGDAIALLRSWARRHGFAASSDSVTCFHLAMLAVHLQQQGSLVSHAASPY
jgi:Nrap protein domain 1